MGKLVDRYNDAVKDKAVRVLTPKYMEFEKQGDCIVGILKGISEVKSSKTEGTYNQYLVLTDVGMAKFAMGSATDKEIQQLLHVGSLYAFTFKGKEKLGGGRSVNKFLVEGIDLDTDSETDNPDDIPF